MEADRIPELEPSGFVAPDADVEYKAPSPDSMLDVNMAMLEPVLRELKLTSEGLGLNTVA